MALILVVDDNKLVRNILTQVLVEDGHQVVTALDGKEALARLVTDKPDLVITDFYMPEMDGAELTRAIRAGEHCRPDLPVIALAGSRQAEEKTKEAGVNTYLPKPLREKVLLDAVHTLLRSRDG